MATSLHLQSVTDGRYLRNQSNGVVYIAGTVLLPGCAAAKGTRGDLHIAIIDVCADRQADPVDR